MKKAELLALLHRLGLTFTVYDHAPVMTVAEAAHIHETVPGMACKCLFLRSKDGRLWLVAVPAALRVDLKLLATALGAPRLSFASPELMRAHLGVTPGAVTVFGAINDGAGLVTVVLEASLPEAELLCFHPLENSSTVSLPPEALLHFLRHTGHEALCVSMAGLPGAVSGMQLPA